jgi:hypothetical protein
MARFPRPYTNQVPAEGGEPMMQYVDFNRLGIGARSSGLPKGDAAPGGIRSLDHVGGSAGSKK